MENSQPSILIRMPNWLGDCIMAMPAVHCLQNSFPNAKMYLAGREQFREFFSAQKGVTAFVPAPASGVGKLLRSMIETRQLVKKTLASDTLFNLGLLFTNSLSTAAWMWRTGSRSRLGYNLDYRKLFLTHPVPYGEVESRLHFVCYYLWLAQCGTSVLNGEKLQLKEKPTVDYVAPSVNVSDQACLQARSLLAEHNVSGKYMVIAPASAYGAVKDWPPDYWRDLVAMINNEFAMPVVVTGGRGQAEVCEQIAEEQKAAVNIAGLTNMDEFAGLLAGASGFVGGDSGGAHMAGALGIPTVVIFGITNPVRTSPGGNAVRILGGNTGSEIKLSSPEAKDRAKKLLTSITPDQVFETLEVLLK